MSFLVPSGPPLSLSIRQLNATSVLVQWLPPVVAQRNGNITAYQVAFYCTLNEVLVVDPAHNLSICF